MDDQWIQEQVQKFMFDFDAADRDRSESLSFSEVCNVLTAQGFNGSQEEAQAIFKDFDCDNNKAITREEYNAAMKNLSKLSIAEFYMRRMFNDMDKDGSGTLSEREIGEEVFQGPYGLGITDKTSMELLMAQSRDNDGMLNYEEFLRIFKIESQIEKIRCIFSQLDSDKSGFIQRNEVYEAMKKDPDLQLADYRFRRLFLAVREDQEKKISFEEFEKIWRGEPMK